jgi:amino acid permease
MKTVIGAGILSLPLTVSRLGYVLSLVIFIIVIAIIQFSAIMLLKAKNLSKHSNYSSISYHIFRTKFAQLICSLMILINNTGICILELTIIKGSLGKIFDGYITGS